LKPNKSRYFSSRNVLVTGGAGFIGSHLVDKLVSENFKVKVLDNIPLISNHISEGTIEFIRKDLKELNDSGNDDLLTEVNAVFHLAAYPDVRSAFDSPYIPFNEIIRNTFYLLERIRKSDAQNILFASTSTVYGEAENFPTNPQIVLLGRFSYSHQSTDRFIGQCFLTPGYRSIRSRIG
jgi:UDP-glucose 4-epimerase